MDRNGADHTDVTHAAFLHALEILGALDCPPLP